MTESGFKTGRALRFYNWENLWGIGDLEKFETPRRQERQVQKQQKVILPFLPWRLGVSNPSYVLEILHSR